MIRLYRAVVYFTFPGLDVENAKALRSEPMRLENAEKILEQLCNQPMPLGGKFHGGDIEFYEGKRNYAEIGNNENWGVYTDEQRKADEEQRKIDLALMS